MAILLMESIIKRPLMTEKSSLLSERSNCYGFVVEKKANKNQIREAVEKLYEVKVLSVRTSIMPGSVKRMGRFTSKTAKYKKAYVQLGKGHRIDFFKSA